MGHFERLERMYYAAPIHDFYKNIQIQVQKREAQITLPIDKRYFHAGNSTHGSVYFKMLDDAAYFACQSLVEDFFLVTASFSVELKRPIVEGEISAIGKVDKIEGNTFKASAELRNEKGRLCGTGHGIFVKSKLLLDSVSDYNC